MNFEEETISTLQEGDSEIAIVRDSDSDMSEAT